MRPFNVDDNTQKHRVNEGKSWITKFFTDRGYTVQDTDDISQYMHFDLLIKKDGRTIWVELKNRDCSSTDYGDVEINEDKYQFLMGAPDKALLIYFFTDQWTMIDVKNTPYTRKYVKNAKYSHCWNTNKVPKTFINWSLSDTKIRLLPYDQ